MNENSNMNKNNNTNSNSNIGNKQFKKVFWGILFLLGAAALLLGSLGYLNGLNFWSILISIAILGLLGDGILKRSFGQILFSLAFLIIVNDRLLHLEAITPWPVLGAALLGSIGLHILFPHHHRYSVPKTPHHPGGTGFSGGNAEEFVSGEEIRCETAFGYAVKYIVGQNISRIFLESSFGNLEVYFNDAVLKNNRAEVFIECSFGNMELYIPSGWNVVMNVRRSFGSLEETGHANLSGANTLFLEGDVSFGHVEIHYI